MSGLMRTVRLTVGLESDLTMANLLNQQRYITDVIAPAARKANSGFDLFWNGCGSGIFVSENDDHEEHARKVAAITWAAAIEACARAAEGFTEERDDRQWVPRSLYDTLRRETAADIRKLSNADVTGLAPAQETTK